MKKKVAILIVNYNGLTWLPKCLVAALETTETEIEKRVYVVDNKSTDGSLDYVSGLSTIQLITLTANLGFAGGNNAGYHYLLNEGWADYIFLLNQDAYLTDNCLSTLVAACQSQPQLIAVQPLLRLYPQTELVNSTGNHIQYLGFGFSGNNGQRLTTEQIQGQTINYCSGAAVLIDLSKIFRVGGLYDDFMFMYLEDLDFGWRSTLAGFRQALVPTATIYHQYEFKRSIRQVYYFERNRLWILFKNYRLGTLLVLLPMILIMELGQLLFALANGWLGAKLKGYVWLLKPTSIRLFWKDRQRTQALRKVSDREILQQFSATIQFQPLDSLGLRVANIVMACYYRLILMIIYW